MSRIAFMMSRHLSEISAKHSLALASTYGVACCELGKLKMKMSYSLVTIV